MSIADRRLEEKEQRRLSIIEAALAVFAEKGVEAATIGDIADRARLSRTLVYVYFKDKDELEWAVCDYVDEILLRRFEAASAPPGTGLQRVARIGRAYVRFAREEPGMFGLMSRSQARVAELANSADGTPGETIGESGRAHLALIARLLVDGVADGSVRRDLGNPIEVAVCLWGMTHGLIQIAALKGDLLGEHLGVQPESMVEHGIELITRSLARA